MVVVVRCQRDKVCHKMNNKNERKREGGRKKADRLICKLLREKMDCC